MANEAAITKLFNDFLSECAKERSFDYFPVGPQDRNVLSDTLLASSSHFALVEMKDSETGINAEVKKEPRTSRLCRALASNAEMQALHDKCHMIAWRDSQNQKLKVSSYRKQVCNQRILGKACGLADVSPDLTAQQRLVQFAEGFFDLPPKFSVSASEFKRYVKWLLKEVTELPTSELHVLASGLDADGDPIAVGLTLEAFLNWYPSRGMSPVNGAASSGPKKRI